MAKPGFFSPLLFLLLFAIFRATLSTNSPDIVSDQTALLTLKSHISHDPHNLLATNWSVSTSVCNWIGVTCGSKHHRVTALNLSSMDLTGTIPSQLGALSFLASLDIRHNSFHGSLPTELTSLHRLKYLNFGKISSVIGNLTSAVEINLTYNNFKGHLPSWTFDNLSKLQLLHLRENRISGTIPSSISKCKELWFLSLNKNSLEGSIPIEIGNLTMLEYLDLGYNNLNGQIPSSICNLSSLLGLSLFNNNLDGAIPECIGSSASSLVYLELGENNFHDLKLLDVGNNYLNDTFPAWLGNLEQLQVLILRWNRFHGQVGSSEVTVSFTRLHAIDISHNNFSGYLPVKFFKNLQAIREGYEKKDKQEYMEDVLAFGTWNYAFRLSFTTKGLETEFEKLLTIWTAIDFSNNQFCGEIPKILGDLHSLIVLNLSHNCLTGPIPSSLGDLSELESLDLSSNQLHGRIPTEFTNLGFLEVLNLSHNDLKGPIPKGKQFDTFTNDSYIGNLGLCGLPLSKSCGNDEGTRTPARLDRDGDDDDDDGINWKFSILMGYGCGLVLGLSTGYIVFATGKPWWFILIYERVQQRCAKR
ncbi:receptor like protein 43 [Hibiscus trionum]|uniref:Receptor like protein 43 n=1 Tax=Hibiscus trionum TaxID=183268 RepID=A0A9W7HKR4_HIBTR|nr:receptor like protein 43 [Hibiscus trionum]